MYSLVQLIKGNTKGVTLKVSIVVVKCQAAQYSRVGLAKLLFRNISLLITVYKDSQFKVKIIVFTAILRFVGIELSQVSQLLAIGLYLGRLQIYNLQIYSLRIYNLRIYGLQIYSLQIYSLRIYNLNNRGNLVHILVYGGIIVYNLGYRGIIVRNLGTRCALASKINSRTAQVYRINLVKRVRYKASNYIKFRTSKEFLSNIILVQDFFLSLLYLVFLISILYKDYIIVTRLSFLTYTPQLRRRVYRLQRAISLQALKTASVKSTKSSLYYSHISLFIKL